MLEISPVSTEMIASYSWRNDFGVFWTKKRFYWQKYSYHWLNCQISPTRWRIPERMWLCTGNFKNCSKYLSDTTEMRWNAYTHPNTPTVATQNRHRELDWVGHVLSDGVPETDAVPVSLDRSVRHQVCRLSTLISNRPSTDLLEFTYNNLGRLLIVWSLLE